jgi:predicted ATP-dependent protease
MLKEEVVEAAAAGKFHVYAVSTVDEALEILTGIPAGTVNEAVMKRLTEMTETLLAMGEERHRSTPASDSEPAD